MLEILELMHIHGVDRGTLNTVEEMTASVQVGRSAQKVFSWMQILASSWGLLISWPGSDEPEIEDHKRWYP